MNADKSEKDFKEKNDLTTIQYYNLLVKDYNENLKDYNYILRITNEIRTELQELNITYDELCEESKLNDDVIGKLLYLKKCLDIFSENIHVLNSQIEDLIITEFEEILNKQERHSRDGYHLLVMLEFRKDLYEIMGKKTPGLKEEYDAFSETLRTKEVPKVLRSLFTVDKSEKN